MALIYKTCAQSDISQRQFVLQELRAGMFDSQFAHKFTNRHPVFLAKGCGEVNRMNSDLSGDFPKILVLGKVFDQYFARLSKPCRRRAHPVSRVPRGLSQKLEC